MDHKTYRFANELQKHFIREREREIVQRIFLIKNKSSVQQSKDTANSFKIVIKSIYS